MTFPSTSISKRRKVRKILIRAWMSIGLDTNHLFNIYDEEYPYYKKYTWHVLYGWFFGEPITTFLHSAYINELCATRRGKILLQCAGGLYTSLRETGKHEFTHRISNFNPVFVEESALVTLFKYILASIKKWIRRYKNGNNQTKKTKVQRMDNFEDG